MATATISDYVIWASHIHDDPRLAARVVSMRAGETIQLDVEGARGTWRKMDDGRDGRPTPGLRPVGSAQEAWRELFKRRRGEIAAIAETNPGVSEDAPAFRDEPGAYHRTDAERQAALAALLDGARQGYRSQGRTLSRDDMHER